LPFNKKLDFFKPNLFLSSNTTLVSKKILISANQIFYQGKIEFLGVKKKCGDWKGNHQIFIV
jgi:hypothetical protein